MTPRRVFVLTGAGISAESGLGTFRDVDGLWMTHRIEDVASRRGYERDPGKVLDFYNARRANLASVAPNAAHFALAQLGNIWAEQGGALTLVTQNVDDLHERAGSRDVIHMHGELIKARCDECGDVRVSDGDIVLGMGCASCGRGACMRPHVVWFGEEPLHMERIHEALAAADLFAAIGTSGAVYPAAGFVAAAADAGMPTIEINLAPSNNAFMFGDARYGKASETVPAWVAEMVALL